MDKKPIGILSSTLKQITPLSELDYETKEIIAELKRKKLPYTIIDPEKLCVGIANNKPVAWFASSDGSNCAEHLQGLLVRRTRGKEEIILDFLEYCKASCPNLCIFDPLHSLKRPTSKVAHLLPKLKLTKHPDTVITSGFLPPDCSMSEPLIIKPSHGYKSEGVQRYTSITDVKEQLTLLINKNKNLGYGIIIQQEIEKQKEFRVIVIGGIALGVVEKIKNSKDDVALSADKGHDFRKYEGYLKNDVCSLAQKAAKQASFDFAGVDIIFDGEQLILLECNRNPQFAAFDRALQKRTARAIVNLMVERIKEVMKENSIEINYNNSNELIKKKPRLFIGSSTEALNIAEALQEGLSKDADVEIWNQGVFEAGDILFSKLAKVAKEFDAAVFIISPDDLVVKKRNEKVKQPRDNILFEIGLFMGSIGTEKVWLVSQRQDVVSLPSDFNGLTIVEWQMQQSGNLIASLGEAHSKIKRLLTSRST